MIIQNYIELHMYINGQEYPLNPGNYTYILMISNTRLHVPVLKFILNDPFSYLSTTNTLDDGSQISLMFNDDSSQTNDSTFHSFRVFGSPKIRPSNTGSNTQYEVVCVLDAPDFIRKSPNKSYVGQSGNVLVQIANEIGFDPVILSSTNDNMTWLPGRQTYANFSHTISDHGWADPLSIMCLGVDENSSMIYVNVSDLVKQQTGKMTFYTGGIPQNLPAPYFQVISYRYVNRSGILNNWVAYPYKLSEQLNSGIISLNDQVKLTKSTGSLQINQNIYSAIGSDGRADIAAINCGNVHQNWTKALYQNRRSKAMYSQDLYVMTDKLTGATLFDPIFAQIDNQATSDSDQTLSGFYLVTAKARLITGTKYYEKLEMSNTGTNLTTNQLLK